MSAANTPTPARRRRGVRIARPAAAPEVPDGPVPLRARLRARSAHTANVNPAIAETTHRIGWMCWMNVISLSSHIVPPLSAGIFVSALFLVLAGP